jgi:hypothetical protein
MAVGGARAGAGRPKGTLAKVTAKAREAAAETGLLPHEWLLKVSRGECIKQKRWVVKYDAKGNEKSAPLSESIEIGLFGGRPGIGAFGKNDVVSIERKPVKNGVQTIVITSKIKPKFAGVDPYNFYIDKNSDDNVVDVTG